MPQRWASAVKQVSSSNFPEALEEIKSHIAGADFVAVSTRKTGDWSSSSSSSQRRRWRRVLPIDTPEVAYLKSKASAERFALFQIAVCPFNLRGPKVLAYPYNFHLFPRDEHNIGLPSYNFSCQTSFLTTMARDGFDFNRCIYDGITYLSRVQESKVRERNPVDRILTPTSSSRTLTVADTIFVGRIKYRIETWRSTCKNAGKESEDCLVKSLRKLVLGGEYYSSRPSISIDVCSNRQAQLVSEVVGNTFEDLIPVVIPGKNGEPKTVCVILSSSDDDKNLLISEIRSSEEKQDLKVRGFREVIDLISSSHKPIIAYNCIHDFTFIHEKFLSPLPSSLVDFRCSLRLAFSNILEVNHILKEIGPLRKSSNMHAALNYLKRQFFLPIEMEFPCQGEEEVADDNHGRDVLGLTYLFAKLSNLLKLAVDDQTPQSPHARLIERYANIFHPSCSSGLEEPGDEDNSTKNLVFLWGFLPGLSAAALKQKLRAADHVFLEGFELRMVDPTCAVVIFWKAGSARTLLEGMGSGNTSPSGGLTEMMSQGMKAAGYDAYEKVCRLGLWESDLTESLENSLR